MNYDKKRLAYLGQIQKSSNLNWKCQCPGCNSRAINSHLLQRHGILSSASVSHKFREVKYRYPVYWGESNKYEFKSVGINEALSYPIFCPKHDAELFHRIETENPDLNNYANQLLFCFRTLCGEIRKFEIVAQQWAMIIKDNEKLGINFENKVKEHIHAILAQGSALRSFKDELVAELNCPTDSFHFEHYSYPKIELYASAILGEEDDILLPGGTMIKQSFFFIHLIPMRDSLEILVGYPINHVNRFYASYTEQWKCLDRLSLGLRLTDLFANKLENFGLSEELYERIPQRTRDKFLDFKNRQGINNAPIDFNLFENIL